MINIDKLQDILYVSCGSLLGANARFLIYKKLEKIYLSKGIIILLINTIASFCLGLFFSILPEIKSLNFSYQLVLFLSIGFLGSLSTFSTFVFDLFELVSKFKFFSALKLIITSLAMGLIALGFGLLVGNQ